MKRLIVVADILSAPEDFTILAQDFNNYRLCGETKSDGDYETVQDIPEEFRQTCLPPEAGMYLTLDEIRSWKPYTQVIQENLALRRENVEIKLALAELAEIVAGGAV